LPSRQGSGSTGTLRYSGAIAPAVPPRPTLQRGLIDMKLSTALVIAPFLLAASAAAEAACVYPQPPQALPNGGSATKEEMLAAQGLVKEYVKSVQEIYLPCLDKERTDATGALDNMDPEFSTKKASIDAIHAKKHNAALDELQVFVDRWNAEKKAFTEKSGK
jgi:hypothetical protein